MATPDRITIVAPGDYPPQVQDSSELDRLAPYGDVRVYPDRPASLEEKIDRVRDSEVILNSRPAVTWPADALRSLPKLRLIAIGGVGTDNVDLETASQMGVTVCNQPGVTAPMVAEHALALVFAVAKRAAYQTSEIKSGRWTRIDNVLLQGKTLGILGTGHVGGELARLANRLGMKVIAWTFYPSEKRGVRLGVRYVELDRLLGESDVISLNLRLSDESRGFIGSRELAKMKPSAILINTGRGELIDTATLAQALNSGRLGGAGLDVFDGEPPSPDDPLLRCEQVVFTPHQGDRTPEGRQALNKGLVDTVIAWIEGRPQNVVVK